MNKTDYVKEVERQLKNEKYYTKIDHDPSNEVKQNILNCTDEILKKNSRVSEEFDIFPDTIHTPQFYVLPKIHKEFQETLPVGYPGRPIVSACNSYTDNISKYVDYILQPYMKTLPSFIKDTTDFLQKLKQIPKLSTNALLVTLDVSSLYTNIPHEDGIDACKYFLNNNVSTSKLAPEELCELIKVVLENNHFQFGDENYIQ